MTGILFFLQEVGVLEALAFCTIAFLLAGYQTLMLLSSMIFITRRIRYNQPEGEVEQNPRK